FAADGRPRSLAEVHDLVAGRIHRHGAGTSPGTLLPQTGNPLPPAQPQPDLAAARARMAYLMLAAMQ
uniref:hypothetical protein n=1 Tax=Sandarakinorhabdus rubra TaxID=2672568 RepID=UPI0038B4E552